MTEQNEVPIQKIEYGSKEHAEAMYVKMLEDINTRMCPLRDNTCRRSCICCKTLKVVNNGPDEKPHWDCIGGNCTAYALVGPT